MEHSELITITTVDGMWRRKHRGTGLITKLAGRPSTIRPGKPIHRYVFQRLLADRVFQATQDIAYNELLISEAESTIKSAESELVILKDIVSGSWDHSSGTKKVNYRARYLTDKMQNTMERVERLEKENAVLKKALEEERDAEEERQAKSKWWVFG